MEHVYACGKLRDVEHPIPAVLTDADRNAIHATNDRFVKAALAADWAALASTYTEDGIVLLPNGPEVRGRVAIQKFYTGPKVTVLKVNLVEIDGQGDLAYTRGTYEIEVMPPGAKAPTRIRENSSMSGESSPTDHGSTPATSGTLTAPPRGS